MELSRSERLKRRIIISIGVFILLVSIIVPGAVRFAIKRDREGAPLQEAIATVAQRIPAETDVDGTKSLAVISVRFRGSVVPAKEIVSFDRLHEGGPARILYRIGRSGRIYVDRVEPPP